MKHIILIIIMIVSITSINAQTRVESSLNKFSEDSTKTWPNVVTLKFDSELVLIINPELVHEYYIDIKRTEIKPGKIIDVSSIVFNKVNLDNGSYKVLSFLDPIGKKWIVTYNGGVLPMWDSIGIYKADTNHEIFPELILNDPDIAGIIHGIAIPNAQNIYIVKGGYPISHLYRVKTSFSKDNYIEVKQDFYFIGSESKTNSDITVFDESMKMQVAQVAKNTTINVIGWIPGKVLIKTNIGLIGWVTLANVTMTSTPDGMSTLKSNIDIFSTWSY